ncbi:hypothetical protein F511_06956 [Dorcoceras hygrometricum]|uniref:Uncharacterized protein n=1 Tax=Dorcoceras hygrometricum TaxID=472368 RepID=A0A2Z7CXL1_9LAMI|nr:hypothetical protein F511_06956 [Dorcoceras hygrometricum]
MLSYIRLLVGFRRHQKNAGFLFYQVLTASDVTVAGFYVNRCGTHGSNSWSNKMQQLVMNKMQQLVANKMQQLVMKKSSSWSRTRCNSWS